MASIPCAAYYASSQIRARQNRSRHSSGASTDSMPDSSVNIMPTTAATPNTSNTSRQSGQFAFNPMSYVKTGPWMNATTTSTTREGSHDVATPSRLTAALNDSLKNPGVKKAYLDN